MDPETCPPPTSRDRRSQSRLRRLEYEATERLLADYASANRVCRDLHRRPLLRPLTQATFNLALYAGLGWVAVSFAWGILLWPAMGLLLAGFLNAAHDCLHNSLFDSKAANRIAGMAWCTPLLVDFTLYKYPHLTHHRYTRIPGDSETWVVLTSLADYGRKMFLNDPFAGAKKSIRAVLGRFPPYIDTADKRRAAQLDGTVVLLWLLVVTALTLVWPWELLCGYWGPFMCFSPMLHLSALPEHWGCAAGPEVRRSTRSVMSNPLVRTVLWNGNFHAEHHLYPSVPSCNLPELSHRLHPHALPQTRSYLGFHIQLLRNLLRTPSPVDEAPPTRKLS